MRNKTYVFSDLGERKQETEAAFRTGMVKNTIAMAEDVNTYGHQIDEQVYIITQEIVNALTGHGIALDQNLNNQLLTMMQTKLGAGYSLTGVYYDGVTKPTATLTSSSVITFSAFTAYFNQRGYFGNTQSDLTEVVMPQTTVTIDNTWGDGVHFLYLNTAGAISHQQTPISAEYMSTMCMLGSVFVVDNSGTKEFQTGSFKYQPWLMSTDHRTREVPVAETKGGYISSYSLTELQMGKLEIVDEAINFDVSDVQPSILDVAAEAPYSHKVIYKGYDPSQAEVDDLDTMHIYNMTTNTYEQVDNSAIGKFMVYVPCITPTGQTLLVAPMSPVDPVTGEYTQVYNTQEEAEMAVFGLHYTGHTEGDYTRERCIYLGQSLIVKIGQDVDLTDNENFKSVGVVPQELSGFTSSAGQAGGSAGQFIPMPEVERVGTTVNLMNFASNVIQGSSQSTTVTVNMPMPSTNRMNEFVAKYTHVAGSNGESLGDGLVFPASVRWWVQPPVFVEGNTYLFTFDYINGYWYGDYSVYSNV